MRADLTAGSALRSAVLMSGLPMRVWAELGWFGLSTVARHRTDPIIGSIILTDRCNLHCQHCAVGNIRRVDYPWQRICADLHALRGQGVRVLFLYGGEPFLWHDGRRGLRDVVREARALGFVSVERRHQRHARAGPPRGRRDPGQRGRHPGPP